MTDAPLSLDRGLPVNPDAERFILGSILLDDSFYPQVAGALATDDLSLRKHQLIYRRMADLAKRGERIDRVTLANELMKHEELEAVDGLSYLVSLDDGLPHIPNLDSYVRIVREKATLRRIVFAAQNLTSAAVAPNADPNALLKQAGERFLSLAEVQDTDELQTAYEVLEGEITRVGADTFLSGGTPGIPTGIKPLNEIVVGWQNGDLILIGARPSVGKTAIAMQTARHAAEHGHGCLFFSLEMGKVSLAVRLACSIANIDSQALRLGILTEEEKRRFLGGVAKLEKLPLWIDKSCRTVAAIHAKIRQARVKRDVRLVIVDYMQLMEGDGGENRNQQLTGISRGLKLAAEEFEVPLIALSQLSRPPKGSNPEPALPDLRDSGSLEQDADVVLFLHAPDGKLGTGPRRVVVAKQRNGPVDSFALAFVGKYQRFEEMTAEAA